MTIPTFSDEARARIFRLVDHVLIGGEEPDVEFYSLPEYSEALLNQHLVAGVMTAYLLERGSNLCVSAVEVRHFSVIDFNPGCYLGVSDTTRPDKPQRLFVLRNSKPSFEWDEIGTEELHAKRLIQRADDAANVRDLAVAQQFIVRVTGLVRVQLRLRLAITRLDTGRQRRVDAAMRNTEALNRLEYLVFVAEIAGIPFETLLSDALQAPVGTA